MWYYSPCIRQTAAVPVPLWRSKESAAACRDADEREFPVVVACASDVLGTAEWRPPQSAVTSDTRYLLIADVPVSALGRLSSVFDVRRPEQRMHVTEDARAVVRLLIAQHRDAPLEGIVDAYLLESRLILLLGDFSIRSFPVAAVPVLCDLEPRDRAAFELDEDGSYLYWPVADLHLGVSQLLQAVDPPYLADIEVRRFPASVAIGARIAALREARDLRQRDIEGLSERHVRRIEQGVARLTGDSAVKLAGALTMDLDEFLTELAEAAADSGALQADVAV
jgi:hypothetical protein